MLVKRSRLVLLPSWSRDQISILRFTHSQVTAYAPPHPPPPPPPPPPPTPTPHPPHPPTPTPPTPPPPPPTPTPPHPPPPPPPTPHTHTPPSFLTNSQHSFQTIRKQSHLHGEITNRYVSPHSTPFFVYIGPLMLGHG